MTEPITSRLKHWLRDSHPGCAITNTWLLAGGTATGMQAFEVECPGQSANRYILRQPSLHDLQRDPEAARHEFTLLQYLTQAGLSVPTPHFLDQDGLYFDTPSLILHYIHGSIVDKPENLHAFAREAAAYLVKVHQIKATAALSFLPQLEVIYHDRLIKPPADLDNALLEGRVREVLAEAWPLPASRPYSLLHGDFWLGNMLWAEDQLVAVIDWENAALGDPLADLATSRLEMLWMFDRAMMDDFTTLYLGNNAIDTAALPWWELSTVLRSAFRIHEWADPADVKSLRDKQFWFFTQALDALGISY